MPNSFDVHMKHESLSLDSLHPLPQVKKLKHVKGKIGGRVSKFASLNKSIRAGGNRQTDTPTENIIF